MGKELTLSARCESRNRSHALIALWQNGGHAGTLCVDEEHAEEIVRLVNAATAMKAAVEATRDYLAAREAGEFEITHRWMAEAAVQAALELLSPGP